MLALGRPLVAKAAGRSRENGVEHLETGVEMNTVHDGMGLARRARRYIGEALRISGRGLLDVVLRQEKMIITGRKDLEA